jgi:hypothetical protein
VVDEDADVVPAGDEPRHERGPERAGRTWHEHQCHLKLLPSSGRRGIERGEIRPSVNPQLAASVLMGPVVFQRLLLQEAPTSQHVATVVDLVMQGISRPEPTD